MREDYFSLFGCVCMLPRYELCYLSVISMEYKLNFDSRILLIIFRSRSVALSAFLPSWRTIARIHSLQKHLASHKTIYHKVLGEHSLAIITNCAQ